MYRTEKFYTGITLLDICEWANEKQVDLVMIRFDENGYCDVIYRERSAAAIVRP